MIQIWPIDFNNGDADKKLQSIFYANLYHTDSVVPGSEICLHN